MTELKKGDNVEHMTEEERKAFRLSIDPDAMGTDGTVSKMTREEVAQYPDRILGTVSAVPHYSQWGYRKNPS